MAVLDHPALPTGDDERFVGFGVMGLPFTSGHYLALRQFPATTFAPAYLSVWHRDPAGNWTFYATTPAAQELCPLLQLGDSQRRGAVRHRRHVDHARGGCRVQNPRTARVDRRHRSQRSPPG